MHIRPPLGSRCPPWRWLTGQQPRFINNPRRMLSAPSPCFPLPQQVPELFIDMAAAMGHPTTDKDAAVAAVLRSIRQLSADVGIPKNLKELVG